MANGSRRTTPTWPTMAAVVSDPSVAAMYTPSFQLFASVTNGTVVDRRPPKIIAEIGTLPDRPTSDGHLQGAHGEVCDAICVRSQAPTNRCPYMPLPIGQVRGRVLVMPSHHTSPSGVSVAGEKSLAFSESMQFDWYRKRCPALRRRIRLPD